jgi:RNA polymerase sigma-70 factor
VVPAPAALRVDPELAGRLYREARADRWQLPLEVFSAALDVSRTKAFAARTPAKKDITRYLTGLHLEDLALACACAIGSDTAWDHFVREMRPGLYRAADALDPSGGARETADALYAELFGVSERGGERPSLLRYFHGRSSLATWLRAVLAQRYVDRRRVERRHTALAEDDPRFLARAPADPECARLRETLNGALQRAIAGLAVRDRLRFGLYYAQQLTLAEIGRTLKEHEATVSRQLARTRARIREAVVVDLTSAGLTDPQIARCFECATEDAGSFDIRRMTGQQQENGAAIVHIERRQ